MRNDYIISDHALVEMERRGISTAQIDEVMKIPEQRLVVKKGRMVFQSRLIVEDKRFLFRVFVDVDRNPMEIVTAYKTSKINKYWRVAP